MKTFEERTNFLKIQGHLPKHVAIIMDGNGRWAKERHLPRVEGHKEGINSVRSAVEMAGQLGIQVLTLYTFSTENWSRPSSEVSALMNLLLTTIKTQVDKLDQNNVRLMVIGDLEALPSAPKMGVKQTIARLSKNSGLIVNLALSYSSRNEIVSTIKTLAQKVVNQELTIHQITEEMVSQHLQTSSIGDPDLLIRTSGEMRLSNFLLWQLAYTELYITPILWPDFREHAFLDAIESFQHRERRFGRVSEQL